MGKLSKKLISLVTTVVVSAGLIFSNVAPIAASAATAVETQQNTETEAVGANQAATIQDGVILHAWCWSFNAIKQNMAEIAAAGYTSVQTSPAQACLVGKNGTKDNTKDNPTWYYHYQPTYFTLGNYQLGTADEFKQMCDVAHQYGVKIIVDVVANHLSTETSKVDQELLNDCHSGQTISNWQDRRQVTQGKVCNMPDINTGGSIAQQKIGNYLVDLAKNGADGFRFDAAKSIELPQETSGAPTSQFWPTVINKAKAINPNLFIYGETLQGDEPGTNFPGYAKIMNVTASTYGWFVRSAVGMETWECLDSNGKSILGGNGNNGKVTPKINEGLTAKYMEGQVKDGSIPNSKLVAFVETHDTYANLGPSRCLSQNQIQLAWAMIASRQGAVPLFFNRPTSQSFGDNYLSPQGEPYNQLGQRGSDDFKAPNVVAINKFHNLMANEEESVSAENNNNIMKIQRGNKGLVLVNVGGSTDINIGTSLPDGQYQNRAAYGGTFTVSGGRVTGNMSSSSIAILYKIDDPDDQTPEVTISQAGGEFKNSLQLTLGYTNATSGTYSIDGAAPVTFTNGKSIPPIGENTPVGGTVKLTVNAIGAKSTTTKTYTFTKIDSVVPKTDADAYLKLPAGWGAPKIYVYDDTVSPAKNNGWPGVAMTDLGDGLFSYKLPTGWTKAKVMFTSGSNQIPGPSLPGFDLVAGQPMIYEDGKWGPYTGGELQVSDLSADNQSITAGTEVTLTGKASGGKGTKTFKFTVNDGTSTEVLSNSTATSVKWTPAKAGNYTIDLVVTDSTGATSNKSIKLVVDKGDGKLPIIEGVSTTKSGNNITYTVNASGGENVGTGLLFYKFYIVNSDGTTSIGQNYSLKNQFTTTATTIKVEVQNSLNDTVSKEVKYNGDIQKDIVISNFATDLQSPQKLGSSIALSTVATGGTGALQTRYTVFDGSKWTIIKNYSSDTVATWKPTKAGTYEVWVDVKDETGKVASQKKSYIIDINNTVLSITSFTANLQSPQKLGSSITLNAIANGGTGTLQTRFSAFDGTKWTIIKNYSLDTVATWKPTKAGTYQVWADVKDETGKVVSKNMTYTIDINNTVLSITSFTANLQSPQKLGSTIALNTVATGGTGALQVRYSVYDGAKWTIVKGYSKDTVGTWKPTKAGTYEVWTDVKDETGKVVSQKMTYVINNNDLFSISSLVTSQISPQKTGTSIVLFSSVTGGSGTVQTSFTVFDGINLTEIKPYSVQQFAIWTPSKAGSYIIFAKAKDDSGKVVLKFMNYTIQ